MIRRRRRPREIPFSFDSFLDIVANVVGIIIRLILVVWVGARSYSSLQIIAKANPSVSEVAVESQEPADPRQQELAGHRRELAEAQERLLAQLRKQQQFEEVQTRTEGELGALVAHRQKLEEEQAALGRARLEGENAYKVVALTSAQLRQRTLSLAQEIHALEQLPSPKQTLRYRTPISRPVQSEELLFECKKGRVTFIDIGGLLREVRQDIEEKGKQLRTRWQVSEVAGPVGVFRLHYTLERERGLLDAIGDPAAPPEGNSFRYGLTAWQIEPVTPIRGEDITTALAGGSEFRQIVDRLDAQQTAVTFWVYPDSFDLFRKLRDYLYERDVMVAGRPLPDGVPIASSRRGSVSRGQ